MIETISLAAEDDLTKRFVSSLSYYSYKFCIAANRHNATLLTSCKQLFFFSKEKE